MQKGTIFENFRFWREREISNITRTCLEYMVTHTGLECFRAGKKSALPGPIAFHTSVCKRHSEDSGRLGLMRRCPWRTLENKCMCKYFTFFLSSAAEERWRRAKAWVRWANQRRYTQKAQHHYQNGWIFLILPRNYTREKVIVESLWW